MDYATLTLEKRGSVAVITLNRPQRLNAINSQMVEELGEVMDNLAADVEIKAVILTGGMKYFCAGADISEVVNITEIDQAFQFARRIQEVFGKISNLSKPVIAAVAGLALGGGCEMMLACDLRVVSENASFGVPEINIGAIPGAGGSQRLPRLLGICQAKEMLFTGERIDAARAYQAGLVNKVVPVEDLMHEAGKLAEKLAAKPPLALKMAKQLINTGMDMDLTSALKLEAHALAYLFVTEDKKEGMTAFLEKRAAKFTGR